MSTRSCWKYLLTIDQAPSPMRALAWSSTDSDRRALAMTPEAIQHLDGASLTRLAYSLGLSPPGTHSANGQLLTMLLALGAPPLPWTPHLSLPQATVVFHSLRERGWRISTRSQRVEEPGILVFFGVTEADHLETMVKVKNWWSTAAIPDDPESDSTEAMAILRCAVLAVASRAGDMPEGGG